MRTWEISWRLCSVQLGGKLGKCHVAQHRCTTHCAQNRDPLAGPFGPLEVKIAPTAWIIKAASIGRLSVASGIQQVVAVEPKKLFADSQFHHKIGKCRLRLEMTIIETPFNPRLSRLPGGLQGPLNPKVAPHALFVPCRKGLNSG